MAIPEVPIRTPFTDAQGNLVRKWIDFFQRFANWPQALTGTHAERLALPADSVPEGSRYTESDRTVVYRAVRTTQKVQEWQYASGVMRETLANKPTDLGTADLNFQFRATDYGRTWRWTGSVWEREDPGDPSTRVELLAIAPGIGWKLADGTGNPVTYSTATAGTATLTLPDLRGAYLKGAAAFNNTLVAATPITVTGGTIDPESSHTHSVTTGNVASGATATTVVVMTGVGVTVPTAAHVHNVPGQAVSSGAGSAHTHTISAITATGGEAAHADLLPYFRL